MKNILNRYQNFYLIGIKGVAMTSIAQCLIDMGKSVRGSDLPEDFVTHTILDRLALSIDSSFDILPGNVECVIYTSAHKGPDNPQVTQALERGIAAFSQAEALGFLCNEKKGIAVCGVGGKSTTSAMITWILTKTNHNPSFSVGVGNIPGLEKTGYWSDESEYFVVEADEYVTDPHAPAKGKEITPRFSYLHPFITVCTNLAYDHPDVYKDFDHTKEVYTRFFSQLKHGGLYIFNKSNENNLPEFVINNGTSFDESVGADFVYTYLPERSQAGRSIAMLQYQDTTYELTLKIPGKYNIQNAVAAIAAVHAVGVDITEAIQALNDFHSTMRRFERIGEKNGVIYYDDYAHHPSEVKAAIQALNDWYPKQRKIIAFQSHTFSRTKQLFSEFVEALSTADEVLLIDIFASAREAFDQTINSDMLVESVINVNPQVKISNIRTIERLAKNLQETTKPGDVVLTLGAGDIYKVHELI